MTIDIRPATDREMSQFGIIGGYVYAGSFGDGPDNLVAAANRPEWTLCGFDGNRMVSTFSTIPFTMRALGKAVPMGGISAVGTIPEYRRRGLLRKTMTQALANMRDAGQPMTALWASQAAIYQRYQFAMTAVLRSYRVDTVNIAFHDGDGGSCTVERIAIEGDFDTIKQLYIAFVADRMGYLHRSRPLWQMGVLAENDNDGPVYVAVATDSNGIPAGYVIYTVRAGRVAHPARSQELRIRDLVWLNLDAYRSLWRFIASHDLVGAVLWQRAPADDPAVELFAEPRLLDARDNEGAWFRIVDLAGALAARGYSGDGTLRIGIPDDDLTPWNQGTWQLEVRDGAATINKTTEAPDIVASIKSLTSLYTGFRSARMLASWGLITASQQAAMTADALFATSHAPHCPDHF